MTTVSRPQAYLVDAARTPVAKRNGGLKDIHPADLGAHVIRTLIVRNDFDPSAVDDVVFGVCDQLGPQAGDVARTCWLAAGLPDDVPGVTIDRQCGSSQQAVHFAAQAVMSGTQDLVVAGGVQNMSMIPISAAYTAAEPWGLSDPFSGSTGWTARYGDEEVSQFRAADMVAEKWQLTRSELDEYGLMSHRRAAHAVDNGWFDKEIVPLAGVGADEGPRRDISIERMAGLVPLRPGGLVTAAHASQISDAASAVLVASERAVADHGLTPRARIHH
ncbi:MAG: acetyl-CoA C-acetyltransferase, partial [Mycobacterium sp.]|nr:acetyl-CoA C-acetyltransferase [Mycobacterium sp.]